MASCIRNIVTKNYQNLIIGFQVTVENVEDFFCHTVYITSAKSAFYAALLALLVLSIGLSVCLVQAFNLKADNILKN